jgi:hypothetical protein
MTPKEKAEELVWKFYQESPLDEIKFYSNDVMAKSCALIAVDEILDTIVVIYSKDFEILNKYWGEVRHEINKL